MMMELNNDYLQNHNLRNCLCVQFSFVGFSIVPGNSWVLEAGREYAITVHVYDKLNHRIIVTEVTDGGYT